MSNTPRTTAIFNAYKWGVNDWETFDKIAALETELATINQRLAEIEQAARFPVGLSDREFQSLHNLGNERETAAVEIVSLRLHAQHLAAENLRLRNPDDAAIEAGMEASLLGRPSVDDDSYVRRIYKAIIDAIVQSKEQKHEH